MMLSPFFQDILIEAGCDEAGRGCLAGPVFAAAVILPKDFFHPKLNDSKKLNEKDRNELRIIIEQEAIDFGVASVTAEEIDKINILQASIKSMQLALDKLKSSFEFIIIDGNKFKPYKSVPYQTIVKGDGKYFSIAAASILAKTYRDEWMKKAHGEFPQYNWIKNKGYGTELHRKALAEFGQSVYHRKTFRLKENQLPLF
jgi:ribonuclease HII